MEIAIGMTYKTAWYVAHRIREATREAKDIQMGDPDQGSLAEGRSLRGVRSRQALADRVH
jgi:hypothetical protein